MDLSKNLNRTKVVVSLDSLQPNDIIFLSQKDDATPYTVIDVGNPFILVENMKTHFGSLYRPTIIYKEVCQ